MCRDQFLFINSSNTSLSSSLSFLTSLSISVTRKKNLKAKENLSSLVVHLASMQHPPNGAECALLKLRLLLFPTHFEMLMQTRISDQPCTI
mmetsp:Transcript_4188/g.4827  ORF Transcript_4188/g.4827 Transcript_4188/m.4827 type:complete len:91 (-) Transcript_4188:548-820(-)